jgi:hypothetical protein
MREEPDCYYDPYCECCKHETQLEQAGRYLHKVLSMLYSKKSLVIPDFENKLEDLCQALGVEMPDDILQIETLMASK